MEIGIRRVSWFDWADCHPVICGGKVARLVGTLLLALFALSSPAQAAVESVAATTKSWTNGYIGGSLTAIIACQNHLPRMQFGYHFVGPVPTTNIYAPLGAMDCLSSNGTIEDVIGVVWPERVCPDPADNPTVPYVYNASTNMCERTVPDCPANSSRSNLYPYQCTCNAGYKFDGVGGICVPLRECTIPDLPPITDPEVQLFEDNPNRADTARLSKRMQTAHACLLRDAAAGSPSTGSAYRPPAYNQHLIDVWKKWREFRTDENYDQQDCAARKEKIRLHFKTHGLLITQQPVPGSDHTRGEAVDVTIKLPSANIDALAAGCHLRRPKPVKDKVHFIYQ